MSEIRDIVHFVTHHHEMSLLICIWHMKNNDPFTHCFVCFAFLTAAFVLMCNSQQHKMLGGYLTFEILVQTWPNLHILGDFMHIWDPKISKVVEKVSLILQWWVTFVTWVHNTLCSLASSQFPRLFHSMHFNVTLPNSCRQRSHDRSSIVIGCCQIWHTIASCEQPRPIRMFCTISYSFLKGCVS
jgi:hypothetical protein